MMLKTIFKAEEAITKAFYVNYSNTSSTSTQQQYTVNQVFNISDINIIHQAKDKKKMHIENITDSTKVEDRVHEARDKKRQRTGNISESSKLKDRVHDNTSDNENNESSASSHKTARYK